MEDNFKNKISDAINDLENQEEYRNQIDDIVRQEQDRQYIEHNGSFGGYAFPNIDGNGNGESKPNAKPKPKPKPKPSKSNSKSDDEEDKRRKIAINKYSGNGRLSLYESVVIELDTKFVRVFTTRDKKGIFYKLSDNVDEDSKTEILIPKGTISTTSPLSYVFTNEEEFR